MLFLVGALFFATGSAMAVLPFLGLLSPIVWLLGLVFLSRAFEVRWGGAALLAGVSCYPVYIQVVMVASWARWAIAKQRKAFVLRQGIASEPLPDLPLPDPHFIHWLIVATAGAILLRLAYPQLGIKRLAFVWCVLFALFPATLGILWMAGHFWPLTA